MIFWFRSTHLVSFDLQMSQYRFSISWSRILPDGSLANINRPGIAYYDKLINSLLQNGIEPIATIFHFDLPQTIQNMGGFTNDVVVGYFEAYADLVFRLFGDRVKTWITINEPLVYCILNYGIGYLAPTIEPVAGVGEYLCGHNVLKAHATAYRLYHKRYVHRIKGKIGISLNSYYFYSNTNDELAVKRGLEFQVICFQFMVDCLF